MATHWEHKMNKFAGLVLDIHDDVDGAVLRGMIADPKDIPDFIKSAELITSDKAASIPDDNYALVLVDHGRKMRKFATVDKGNTALSVLYLLKQAHLLPGKAVKVAAANLLEACDRFHLEAPEQLKLAASTGISSISDESDAHFRRAVDSREGEERPELGKGDASADVRNRANTEPVMGTNFMEVPPFTTKERFSDQKGTSIDNEKLASADLTGMFSSGVNVSTRKRNWRTSPYVDVADWEPGADSLHKVASASRTLLNGKYPVDSYDQVKLAEKYLEEHHLKFHPEYRRAYCVKLAERQQELGIESSSLVEKYASAGYGGDVDAHVLYRRRFVTEDMHPVLEMMVEKRAQVNPETFVEALHEFDKIAHLKHLWGSSISDPWASTYGLSLEKVAEEDWDWEENGVYVDEDDLENLATNGMQLLVKSFGEKFAEEFRKEPKTFFQALPLPNKLVLGRMAMDRYSGTGTE